MARSLPRFLSAGASTDFHKAAMKRFQRFSFSLQLALLAVLVVAVVRVEHCAMTNDECLVCHDDPSLKTSTGKSVSVSPAAFSSSVHKDLSCTDCHSQTANFENAPHFTNYQKVDCASCHDEAGKSF